MVRLIVLLFAFLKLLVVGKWYPPAHVRDVSTGDFIDLREAVIDLARELDETRRQTEATRKKVYRDEGQAGGERGDKDVIPPVTTPNQGVEQFLAGLNAGDEVPEGIL